MPGEVRQDKPVLQDSVMPLLAAPLMPVQIAKFQTLKVYFSKSDFQDAAGNHWSSPTVQQQINETIPEIQKKEVCPLFIFSYGLYVPFLISYVIQMLRLQDQLLAKGDPNGDFVSPEEDFLVTGVIYHAAQPENTPPDEQKLYVS